MLKIYYAYADHGEIKVEDHITFNYGRFYTGPDGFGEVLSGNLDCTKANYELRALKDFREYSKRVEVVDGWAQGFTIWNPMSYEKLVEEYKNIDRTPQNYEKYGLNEEGILLFTDYIRLKYYNSDLIQRIFGRCATTGLYLLMPNASVSMTIVSHSDKDAENYEVLQSQGLGKKLVLTKMNRDI